MAMIEITKENFAEQVEEKPGRVLLDFWADWCGPCRMLSPLVEQVAEEYGDKLAFGKVNVDQQPELAAAFEILSIPALLLFQDGKLVDQSIGVIPKAALLHFLGL